MLPCAADHAELYFAGNLQAVVLIGFTPDEFTAFRSMMIAMEVC